MFPFANGKYEGVRGVLLAILSMVEVWIFFETTHSLSKLGCIL